MLGGKRRGLIQAGSIREGFLEEEVSQSRPEGQMGVSQAEMRACSRERGRVQRPTGQRERGRSPLTAFDWLEVARILAWTMAVGAIDRD